MTTFNAQKVYRTVNCGNFLIVSRTEKTAIIDSPEGEKRCKIHAIDGVETLFPFGCYSMAPVLKADRLAA